MRNIFAVTKQESPFTINYLMILFLTGLVTKHEITLPYEENRNYNFIDANCDDERKTLKASAYCIFWQYKTKLIFPSEINIVK